VIPVSTKLSILDFFSSPPGVLDLVELCEQLGCYERYWIGEHHGSGQIPDPLSIALLGAGVTDRIRVGTGAVSLTYRNPYLIAETALIAEVFYPGRIDLGVTRAAMSAPGLMPLLSDGLDHDRAVDGYEDRVRMLRDILLRITPGGDAAASAYLRPLVPLGPPLYVMATSPARAAHAGALGAGLCTSLHHGLDLTRASAVVASYRRSFAPTPWFREPHVIVVVSGHVDHDERACARAAAQDQAFGDRAIRSGDFAGHPVSVFAPPHQAAARLRAIAQQVRADEVMFLALDDSATSYRALADGWTETATAAAALGA
jgi:alkanesulfonate monooxygenase SsuD/methylene tetrahydromethanopterin reductase-like flavin-dependent oxidoreductase (luciferase family)